MEILPAVAAVRGGEVVLVGDAERAELHLQPVDSLVPVVERVAAEELVRRPRQRVDVQRGGVLAGVFGVAIELPQRGGHLGLGWRVVDPLVEVDGRGDGGHDWEPTRVFVSDSQGPLPSHANAQQADAWRLDLPPLADELHDVLHHKLLGGPLGVERLARPRRPPAFARLGGDAAEAVAGEFGGKNRVVGQVFAPRGVQINGHVALRVGLGRLEHANGVPGHFGRLPRASGTRLLYHVRDPLHFALVPLHLPMPHTILHVASSLDRYSSAESLLSLLAAWPSDDCVHRVLVLGGTQGALADEFMQLGIEFDPLWQRWRLDPTTIGRIASQVTKIKPDIVHTWDSSALHYVQAAAVVAKVPRLLAEWDLDVLDSTLPDLTRLLALTQPTPRFVVPSQRVTDWLLRRLPAERLTTIPPAPRQSTALPLRRDELFEQLSLPAEAKLVGTACPLRVEFGLKELIWAADMLQMLHPLLRYLIAGDGPERHHLERFASTAAQRENIVFLGPTESLQALPHLDVYWQGSQPGASSTQMVLQAMAAEVPVVASDTPRHRDLIEHQRTGYLVGFDARSERTRITDNLLVELSTARGIANAATEYVTGAHSPKARVEAYQNLYVDLMG